MSRAFSHSLRCTLGLVLILGCPGLSVAQRSERSRVSGVIDTATAERRSDSTLLVSPALVPLSSRKVPFAIGRLTSADMLVPGVSSALGSLDGKMAGVEVSRPGGAPGSDVSVTLRTAFGVLSTIPPQIVMDGVWLNSGHPFTVQDLESADVASIEVLKGPIASALYGSRGAAGVIVITTNRGQSLRTNETRFTVRNEIGADILGDWYEPLLAHPYRVNASGQYVDANGVVVSRTNRVLTSSGIVENRYVVPTYNQADQFFRSGLFNTQTASLQQNRAATNFNLAYTRNQQAGLVPDGDGYGRQTLRLNADYRVGRWGRASVSASHARAKEDPAQESFGVVTINPDVNIRAADPAGFFRFIPIPDSTEGFVNPLNQQRFPHSKIERRRTLLNANVSVQPLSFLSLSVAGSYDRGDRDQFQLTPRGTRNLDGRSIGTGYVNAVNDNSDGSLMYGGATVQKRVGSLQTRLSVRTETQRQSYSTSDSTGQIFNDAGVATLVSRHNKSRIAKTNSVIGNLGLDYSDKYVADVLVRREKVPHTNADLPKDLFTRVSAAWLASNESWFPGSNANLFKLHAAVGTSVQHVASQQYLPLDQQPSNTSPTNNARATEREFGLDVSRGSRIQGSLTYVSSLLRNPVFALNSAPCVSGYCGIPPGASSVTGHTVEGTLQARLINNAHGLTWDVLAVGDRRRAKIKKFDRTCFTDGLSRQCANADINSMMGHRLMNNKDDLINQSASFKAAFDINDEGFLVPVGTGNTWRDGKSKNLWGTNVVVEGRTYPWGLPLVAYDSNGFQKESQIGNSNPDLQFGFQNNIRYRGFRFYTQFAGQLGGDVYNNVKQFLYASGDHVDLDQSGKADELRKPRTYFRAVANGNADYLANFVESATHARLAEASIGYEFKAGASGLLRRIGASRLQVDFVGRNLFTLTGYSGLNPAGTVTNPRVDNLTYPTARTFTLATTISF